MKIKILRNAETTFTRVCWNVAIEYKGKKYVVLADEDDNGGEHYLYHFDEEKRYNIGEQVDDETLNQELIDGMFDLGIMSPSSLLEGEVHDLEDE